MDELTLNPDTVRALILKVRAVMAREETASTPDPGGNAIDDENPVALQDLPGDLSRLDAIQTIDGLSPIEQAELVALMWIGRGDAEPAEWADMVRMAQEQHEGPTGEYLLGHPLVADDWADGLEALGYAGIAAET